ncbi:MAG: 3-oxoacyl-ACP reductase FabG [Pseudomonadota bacterium]|nr:3-oxoacyl-ACP reductase FabG [Pseudomonadota bacterium]
MTTKLLAGRVCLVTGASRGIGRAIALALGRQGGVVVGTATTDAGAAGIGEGFAQAGIAGRGMRLNVTDGEAVATTIKAIADEHGAVEVLVNNAGITRDNLLLRMKESQWDEIMDTNLKSVYRLSKACLRGMTKARFGRIVNISSVVGAIGNPGQANYAAAKAGLAGFTMSLAHEVASRDITVNSVAPGFIETDMTRELPEAARQTLLEKIPLGRLGAPEDIADAVVFLASPMADYITGTTLHVNGGMYMTS